MEKSFIEKLMDGDIGLFKTFWIYFFGVSNLIAFIALKVAEYSLIFSILLLIVEIYIFFLLWDVFGTLLINIKDLKYGQYLLK